MGIISSYRDNDGIREQFNTLSRKVFGIDFNELYKKGLWGDDFECHSILLDNTLIANVSVIKHIMIIGRKRIKTLQFCTVMTDPMHIRNGHIRALMEHIITMYANEYKYMYLYANDEVTGLYAKFGFRKTHCSALYLNRIEQFDDKLHLIKLDMNSAKDVNLLRGIISNRNINSCEYAVEGADTVLLWNCLNSYKEHSYYDETHQMIVICETAGKIMHIYGIFSTSNISIYRILSSMPGIMGREAILHFNAEYEGKASDVQVNRVNDNLMVRSELNTSHPVIFDSAFHA